MYIYVASHHAGQLSCGVSSLPTSAQSSRSPLPSGFPLLLVDEIVWKDCSAPSQNALLDLTPFHMTLDFAC